MENWWVTAPHGLLYYRLLPLSWQLANRSREFEHFEAFVHKSYLKMATKSDNCCRKHCPFSFHHVFVGVETEFMFNFGARTEGDWESYLQLCRASVVSVVQSILFLFVMHLKILKDSSHSFEISVTGQTSLKCLCAFPRWIADLRKQFFRVP